MAGNIPGYFLCFFLLGPPFYVAQLKMMDWVQHNVSNKAISEITQFLACYLAMVAFAFTSGAFNGMGKNTKLAPTNPVWKVGALGIVLTFGILHYVLFYRRKSVPRKTDSSYNAALGA